MSITKLNKALVIATAVAFGIGMGQTAFAQATPDTQQTPNTLQHPQSLQSNGMSSGKKGNDTQRSRVWQSMDANHDGSVSKAEYMDHCDKMFVKLDVDKNGMVSQSEWQTGMKMAGTSTEKAGVSHDEMDHAKVSGSKMTQGGTEGREMGQRWSAMDPGHKGSVSKPDFSAYCANTFKKLDTNRDGMLSEQEWGQGMHQ